MTGLFVLLLSVTGAVVVLDWYWGFRIAPVIGVFILLFMPLILGISRLGIAEYLLVPFIGVLLITMVESILRFPDELHQLMTETAGKTALAVGFLHFLLGFSLQVITRRLWWIDPVYGVSGLMEEFLIYFIAGCGLVATGVLPIVLWRCWRLVTPIVLITGWSTWGIYGVWVSRTILPLSDFYTIQYAIPRPYPDYMLRWAILVLFLLVVAGLELAVRKLVNIFGGYIDASLN